MAGGGGQPETIFFRARRWHTSQDRATRSQQGRGARIQSGQQVPSSIDNTFMTRPTATNQAICRQRQVVG